MLWLHTTFTWNMCILLSLLFVLLFHWNQMRSVLLCHFTPLNPFRGFPPFYRQLLVWPSPDVTKAIAFIASNQHVHDLGYLLLDNHLLSSTSHSCHSWEHPHRVRTGPRKSCGILFFSFPGLESHGIFCRVMESHGKLNHYLKNHESIFIVYYDRQKFHWMCFTELWIISHGKDRKSHRKSHEKSWNFL